MTDIRNLRPEEAAPAQAQSAAHTGENAAAVHAFYEREERLRSAPQRHAESLGGLIGRPAFLLISLLFVVAWIGINLALAAAQLEPFDVPPYHWLQGVIGLAALLITTVVVIKQDRMDKLDVQRAHLELKVTLMIEQKTAKLIDLIEELRRDLPNVRNRHDSGAIAMQHALSAQDIRATLDMKLPASDASDAQLITTPP
jgi:uncharacterized membrane protein